MNARTSRNARTLRRLLVLALLVGAAALAAPALGQDPAAGLDAPSRPAAVGGSFGEAFFVSRRTDPVTNEKSIEIIGSLVIWFLLMLSALSFGLMGTMLFTNQRRAIVPDGVIDEVRTLMTGSKYRETLELTGEEPSFFSQVLHAGLQEASHGFAAIIRRLEQTSDELTTVRLRRIEYLNVLGQVSPMIGLFGTVYGMILAFQAIVASGGNADPILLAGGIGTALTTTFWGLVVAIPALAGYAIIRNRIDELTTEATLRAEELLNQFRPRPTGQGSRPSPKPKPKPKES
ncbi:MAG: MotA/TolQ/ExbB proton channel family protein [Planctomycetota bacterium]|jgi:biopolymer transport protein ExbB